MGLHGAHAYPGFLGSRGVPSPTSEGWTGQRGVSSVAAMTSPTAHRPTGDGTEWYAVDAAVVLKVGAAETGGLFEVFEVYAPRGLAPPPHRDPWHKAFYVLHGRIAVQVGDTTSDLGPGAAVSIPAGAANAFTVLTPAAVFLAVSLGDGMGRFFADLDARVPRDRPLPDVVPVVLDVTERHGIAFAAAPLPAG